MMQIFVKGLEGKTIILGGEGAPPVTKEMNIAAMRTMIKQRLGIPEDHQLLIFAGKPLVDSSEAGVVMTLEDYGIQANSTIHLALRLIGGSNPVVPILELRVKLCNNEEVKLNVSDQITVSDLKAAVYAAKNVMSADCMTLMYAGINLDNSLKLK
jgi:hypothetical protein